MKTLRQKMRAWFFHHRAIAMNEAAQLDCKAELLKILGLAADATDEAIAAELAKLKGDADAAKKAADAEAAEMEKLKGEAIAANAKVTTAEALATNAKKLAVNSALTLAITTGRITGAQRAEWEGKLNADLTQCESLEKLTPAFNTQQLNLQQGGALTVPATPRERMIAWNSAVIAKARAEKITDAEAEKSLAGDPKYKPLYDAMNAVEVAK